MLSGTAQCKAGGCIRDDRRRLVFSIIPSSRSTQSKDKETLYPSLPLPHSQRPPRPPLPGLLCSSIDSPVSGLVCSCSSVSQNQRLQKPVFERDKGKSKDIGPGVPQAPLSTKSLTHLQPFRLYSHTSPTISPRLIWPVDTRSLVAVAVPVTPPRPSDQVSRSSSMRITCKTNPVGIST